MARRPACELLPWASECSGQAISPHPTIFPSTSSWAGIPTLFRGGSLQSPPVIQAAFFALLLSPCRSGRRHEAWQPVCKQGRGAATGFHDARGLPGQTPSAVDSVGSGNRRLTATSFSLSNFSLPLTALFHPIFSKVCSRHGGRGWDGSRPSGDEGWGGRRQFRFDANDLCTIQGQRVICEACAPTHASIHNLVLDYISI